MLYAEQVGSEEGAAHPRRGKWAGPLNFSSFFFSFAVSLSLFFLGRPT
jgi:hypothetical protein